jgi:lactococcin 972 family bacteriocin
VGNRKSAVVTGLLLATGLVVVPAVGASAVDVLGSAPGSGGVVITDGTGPTGEVRGSGTRRDGGGGSFWQWGVGRDDTWSNYFRERRCHGATAVGLKTKRVTGVPGGRYALATTPKARSGNKAYYHNC